MLLLLLASWSIEAAIVRRPIGVVVQQLLLLLLLLLVDPSQIVVVATRFGAAAQFIKVQKFILRLLLIVIGSIGGASSTIRACRPAAHREVIKV